ncbi:MAG: hypothetical protein R3202_06330 [Candidatus Competibacterales bacterium]|nr:hypothetical protein [Candidatus Competibacterales bacterium]
MSTAQSAPTKKYGIHMTLPPGDPMRAPHLLGDEWEAYRWFETPEAREQAIRELEQKHPYYRTGDYPSLVLARVER